MNKTFRLLALVWAYGYESHCTSNMISKKQLATVTEALATASVVGVGLVIGGPLGATVMAGIGINLGSDIIRDGSTHLKEQWLSAKHGVLNHDLQRALARALVKALIQLEARYFELPEANAQSSERKQAIRGLFKELKNEAPSVFAGSVEKIVSGQEVKEYLYGEPQTASAKLWERVEGTKLLYTYYGEHLKEFLRANINNELVRWFHEELKTDNRECNKAWRAFQWMLLEGIQADVKAVHASQETISQELQVLGGIRTQLDELKDTIDRRVTGEPFQQGLEDSLQSIKALLENVAGITQRTETKVDILVARSERSETKIDTVVAALNRKPESAIARHDDRLTSLRADLRAKINRAQELDARDERKAALAQLDEVYHTAKAHGLKIEQLEVVLNLGFATSDKHDFKARERRFREAEKLIRGVENAWHQIQYWRLKSMILRHKKHFAPAEKALKKAIALSQSGDEKLFEVALLARADYIHLLCDAKRLDEVDEHLAFARDVVEGKEGTHPVGLIADLLDACIHWAISNGDIKEVSAFVGAALRHGKGREAALAICHALQHCANGARGMRATNVSVICADAAERLGHAAQSPTLALAAAYTAAGALAESKDFHAARERCLRLIDGVKAVDEPVLRFCVFQLLSQTSRQLGDKTTAVEAAEAALRETEGEATEMCLAKMALAEALRDCGRVKEAMEYARTAYDFSEHCDLPPEWVDETLVLIADCASRLGDWATAESYSVLLGKRSLATRGSQDRRSMLENRIQMHKMIRESLTSVISASAPLSVARTEAADSVQTANAMLMHGLLDAWKEYPNAATAFYDYWGRGNLSRVMLNMRAFPSAFNITLEVHSVEEARQAVRLWALIADVLILIWKGPTVSSPVMCPVPPSFDTAGGGGYFAAILDGGPSPSEVTAFTNWKKKPLKPGPTYAIFAKYASLLPVDVGQFLVEEAAPLVSLGRLILVPSTGICCIGTGHGPVESLFAEACNAMPAIKGDAARFPASWVPYFPDIPLAVLADIVLEQEVSLRRLRLLLMRKTRQFRSSGIIGGEAKELELEIQDSLSQITEAQSRLRQKHGWGEAQEAVASRYDGFNEQEVAPILLLQNMGYRWRVEHAIGGPAPETNLLPKSNEPIGTWLHPPDTKPEVLTEEHVRNINQDKRRKRR